MKFLTIRAGSIVAAVAFCLMLSSFAGRQSSFTQQLIVLAGLFVTLSVSLNLINGITGQFSIGHAAFFQVGAYTSAFLGQSLYAKSHLSPVAWLFVVMLGGAITAGIAGFMVGLPSLRLKGDYLAVVTLGFGEIVRIIVQNQKVLGESSGMSVSPHSGLETPLVWVVALLAILCIAVCRNLLKTAHGLTFLAVREDEVASSAMGVNVTGTKVTAFVIGSAFAGAAGALYANALGFITPDLFKMDVSFIILTMVVLGGTGSITGSAISAIILFYIPEKMRDITDVKLSLLLGIAVGICGGVVGARYIIEKVHKPVRIRGLMYFGVVAAALIAALILGKVLGSVPSLSGSVEGAKLRMVVFSVTLVVLMLVRPQGIFGHHEFSWSWVKRLLGNRNEPKTEVASV